MNGRFASRNILAIALLVGVGTGCGSTTSGCTDLGPIPPGLTPFGVPNNQVIEGGVQARITAQGMTKLSAGLESTLSSTLASSAGCIISEDNFVGTYGSSEGYVTLCPDVQASCGKAACGASVILDSSQRPAPNNVQDNVDHVTFSMADGANPVLNVVASFDIDLPVKLAYGASIVGISASTCTLELYTPHYYAPSPAANVNMTIPIQLGTDATTGKLTIAAQAIQVSSLGLQTKVVNCPGALGDVLDIFSDGVNDIFSGLNSQVGNFFVNILTAALQPQINQIVQGFLPNPLGLANTIETGVALSTYSPPPTAGLETYLVPGGYVSSKSNGLTLGVLAGMNSDSNPATRTATTSSEPDPCVPSRPVPALAAAPYNLPANAARQDFTLNAADQFAGSPDPVDSTGATRDVLLGISRTYLDLLGFHLYNSGTMCLHVDGSTITELSTGTIGLVMPSLENISLDPKAPLELVLRPQTAPIFTLGAGTDSDSLIHIGIQDLRIDMYAWIEDRWARVLTLGVDLNLGINLTVTKNAAMQPVLQPVLSGLSMGQVGITITNSDLLAETPAALEAALPSLISIAAGTLTGALPTLALPSVAGFSLDDLDVERVQSSQDDFLGLFATLTPPSSPAPLIDWSDPQHPRLAGELRTHVAITSKFVPSATQMGQIFDPSIAPPPAHPSVTLALSADNANGGAVEYAYKIDGNAWRNWSSNANPTITDDAFLLQAHHSIQVRARLVGNYRSEDSQPPTVDALFDSVPPGLNAHLDDKDQNTFDLDGWDLVSDADHLEYAWRDANGEVRPFGKVNKLSVSDVARITNSGEKNLVVLVRDEAGNVSTQSINVLSLGHGSWGRTTTTGTGCGCDLGGADRGTPVGALVVVGVMGLWLLRRRRATMLVLALTIGIGGSSMLVGCGTSKNYACTVDDDCSATSCATNQIPSCASNTCGCVNDLPEGQQGRFASMTVIDAKVFVAAYNQTYGDLVIGNTAQAGKVTQWDFVDGIPDSPPDVAGSHVRGGVSAPGPDVGQYTSIAQSKTNQPIMAYYDATNGALKFASFGAIRWRSHVVDQSTATGATPDQVGIWTSMTVGPDGKPGIAYAALATANTQSGMPEGQLRFAQATTTDPQLPTDWTITVVDSRPLPAMPTATNDLLPDSIAIMTSSARKADGTVVISYYDRLNGNLRLAQQDSTGKWSTSIVDGQATDGTDTGDVGQYSSIAVDSADVVHISYVDASHDNLIYVNTQTNAPEIVDDGYRPDDETTSDGLPSPVYHLVGDSSSIAVKSTGVYVAYQDSTAVQLRLANRDSTGKWTTQAIAGHADPFTGSYGFWAGITLFGTGAYLGSYGIDQQATPISDYYETFFVDFGPGPVN